VLLYEGLECFVLKGCSVLSLVNHARGLEDYWIVLSYFDFL